MVTTGTSSDLEQDAKSMLRTTPGNMIDRGRADKAAARQLEHEWAVILAGGDGTRLKSLSRRITGDERPKQFCPVFGDMTLLEETQRRVAIELAKERTLFVVNRHHEPYYAGILGDTPVGNLIEQPRNIVTAPAILYRTEPRSRIYPNGRLTAALAGKLLKVFGSQSGLDRRFAAA